MQAGEDQMDLYPKFILLVSNNCILNIIITRFLGVRKGQIRLIQISLIGTIKNGERCDQEHAELCVSETCSSCGARGNRCGLRLRSPCTKSHDCCSLQCVNAKCVKHLSKNPILKFGGAIQFKSKTKATKFFAL